MRRLIRPKTISGKIRLFSLILYLSSSTLVLAQNKPSTAVSRTLQTRGFPTDVKTTLKASINALQDLDYTIDVLNSDVGLITASRTTEEKKAEVSTVETVNTETNSNNEEAVKAEQTQTCVKVLGIAFVAIFGGVVFIHELGHFLAARSVGVRVERFYVGFDFFGLGYTIYKGKETEYGIGLFPFGGYCKIAGMVDESLDESVKGSDDEFNSKNTIEKLWILSAGVIMNFILAIFLFIFIYNFYGLQEQPTVVNEVSKNDNFNEDLTLF